MIPEEKDVCGKALHDYYLGRYEGELLLHTSYGDTEEMPPEVFFRDFDDFPELEAYALESCRGKVLDVGAGTGCHSLLLQEWGLEANPLEISPHCLRIIEARNIEHAIGGDVMRHRGMQYDTVLMMMHGIGIAGTLAGLRNLLAHLQSIAQPDGQLLFDSSDISYLYDGQPMPQDRYFGELSYQYEYQGQKGDWFPWLYLDIDTLHAEATACGWETEILFEQEDGQYLARLIAR